METVESHKSCIIKTARLPHVITKRDLVLTDLDLERVSYPARYIVHLIAISLDKQVPKL